MEEVQRACEELFPFDAVVAENGAVISLPGLGRTIGMGGPPPEYFLGELRAQGVPFHTGAVIVGTWEQQANTRCLISSAVLVSTGSLPSS